MLNSLKTSIVSYTKDYTNNISIFGNNNKEDKGEEGDKGEDGDKGEKGIRGDRGPRGKQGIIEISAYNETLAKGALYYDINGFIKIVL